MIEALLRLLDILLGLREPKPADPPEPPEGYAEKHIEKLTCLYGELGAEMRALRSTEFSIANLFYAVAGLLFAGNLSVLASDKLTFVMKAACVAATLFFLLCFWISVHRRIAHDNESYAYLMSRRRYLERKWFWPGMPGKPDNTGSGASGPGYRKTQSLIALSATAVMVILAILLVLVADWKLLCTTRPAGLPEATMPLAASSPASTAMK